MPESIINLKLGYSISNLLGSFLLLLTVFPYLQLIPSDSYTQPFAFLLGAVLFFMHSWPVLFRLPFYDQIALGGLAIVGIFIFFITCFPYTNQQEYKYLLSYLSPLLVTIPLLRYVEHAPATAVRLLRLSILIWIVIALIQKFLDSTFLGFLVGPWGESALDIVQSGRGVLGLAPEPTHHAFHILLLAASLAILDANRRSRWVLIFCGVDAIFLAASSSALLVVGIAVILWLFFYRQRWFVVAGLLGAAAWEFADQFFMNSEYRIGQLISAVLADPSSLLTVDYSMNMRLGGMLAVIMEVFHNLFLPFGMSVQAWETARIGLLADLPWLIDLSSVGPPSGIGMLLFQGGAVGGLLISMIFHRILSSRVSTLGRILLIACPFVFLGQFYISTPTFALLYACALYSQGHRTALKVSKSDCLRSETT